MERFFLLIIEKKKSRNVKNIQGKYLEVKMPSYTFATFLYNLLAVNDVQKEKLLVQV